MAARKRKVALTDDWRANIQATSIMNRLYGHAVGEIEMTQTQIKAAQVVLAKILPDLKAMEMTGPDGGPLEQSININVGFSS